MPPRLPSFAPHPAPWRCPIYAQGRAPVPARSITGFLVDCRRTSTLWRGLNACGLRPCCRRFAGRAFTRILSARRVRGLPAAVSAGNLSACFGSGTSSYSCSQGAFTSAGRATIHYAAIRGYTFTGTAGPGPGSNIDSRLGCDSWPASTTGSDQFYD